MLFRSQPLAAVGALRPSRETAESVPPGTSRRGHLACRKPELPGPDDAAKCAPIPGRCTRSSPPPRFVEGPSFHQGFDLSLEGLARDRKSTRLNSSHGYISYAVFCLKKKKTNEHTRCSLRQRAYNPDKRAEFWSDCSAEHLGRIILDRLDSTLEYTHRNALVHSMEHD